MILELGLLSVTATKPALGENASEPSIKVKEHLVFTWKRGRAWWQLPRGKY